MEIRMNLRKNYIFHHYTPNYFYLLTEFIKKQKI